MSLLEPSFILLKGWFFLTGAPLTATYGRLPGKGITP